MKPQILFVDDEAKILHGLKRMLYSMNNEWDMFFVEGGNHALKILAEMKIDIVVSDMRMPEMDGTELLDKIMHAYPDVIRIILSGYSDKDAVLSVTKTAHRFLAKPCNPDKLKSVIKKLINLKQQFPSREIFPLITGLDTIPANQKYSDKLLKELNLSNCSIKKVSELISKDAAMTAKILQIVNSAFFSLPQKIVNPVTAINLLGIEVIKSLVLFAKIFASFEIQENSKNFFNNIYDHSLKVANLAKEIAAKETSDEKIINAAFTGGLLHDIGKIIFLKLEGYHFKVISAMEEMGISFSEAEQLLYKTTHSELGEYLLKLWGLPGELSLIVRYHHNPFDFADRINAMSVVYIANSIICKEIIDYSYLSKIGVKSDFSNYIQNRTEEFN